MSWLDYLPATRGDLKRLEARMNQQVADALARLNASVSKELKAIADKLGQPDADNTAIAAQINSVADTLDNETATLTGGAASTGSGGTQG